MASKDRRSASQRRPSGQARPDSEPRSKLRDALASAGALISHFPQKFKRLSSSLRTSSRHPSATQPRNSKAMSSLSGYTAPTGSSGPLDAILHGRPSQPSITPDSSNMPYQGGSKENVPPPDSVVPRLSRLSLNENPPTPKNLAIQPPNPPGRTEEERQTHQRFTNDALDMARLALRTNETPVGCVLVHNGTIIAKGMNATNVTRNGTRHAEFMAIVSLLARPKKGKKPYGAANGGLRRVNIPVEDTESSSEDENPAAGGHLYPYGQKFHPAEIVDKSIIRECTLYVTVEPCVMCASLLRQLGIKKVFFGAVNDKFGGTGGVFSIHKNPSPLDGEIGEPRGDGGSVELGYEAEGGWGRDDAVGLLRRFYVQENGRAPVPRKKEGRAARLAALERDANGGSVTSVTPETGEPNTAPDSVAGEENQAQEGQPKLNGQAEETRVDEGKADPNGEVERGQAANEQPDFIDLEDKKNGIGQGASNPNGKGVGRSWAGDKQPNLLELSDSDSREDEKESINGRVAEAIPA